MNIALRGLLNHNTMGKEAKKYIKEQVGQKMSEAEQEAYEKDAKAFNEGLKALCEKYRLGLVGIPHFAQMDNGLFSVNCSVRAVRMNPQSELAKG